ncbi:DpnI domain-containing protein [Falsiroseomonas sp.]|uniref:DpnI domain-containing protein n=1 Tax=Falsiroseomonas sp. TaxID=2870721 RepID=UPI003F6F60E8
MQLGFDLSLADGYRSGAQRARRLTEGWFATAMYCVACGEAALVQHPNNAQANDFFCHACGASFELKSGRKPLGATVPDGAFSTMIERLERRGGGPHLVLLRYCPEKLAVRDLLVVPASFLTRDVIVERPPLGPLARRAGWVGCNIRIAGIPDAGRIAVIRDGVATPRSVVVGAVRRAALVEGDLAARTWLVDTLRCVERLGSEFTLAEVYGFEAEFGRRHPGNQHIRPKLRQQLQRLRDAGLLAFLGHGRYRRLEG